MDYQIINADCANTLPDYEGQVNLVVTSPPYGQLRDYGGYGFDFERIAAPLAACLAPGGVLIWVVADAVIDGSETGDSLRQTIAFMDLGLRLHDTMIYEKSGAINSTPNRYEQAFEYMFVFSNGAPATFNPIMDKFNVKSGSVNHWGKSKGRNSNGERPESLRGHRQTPEFGKRTNIWRYSAGKAEGTNQKESVTFEFLAQHPARFPLAMAKDHILTWSEPGDFVLDPMAGSGTTIRAAADLGRRAVGIEIHKPYCDLIERRMAQRVLDFA